MNETAARDPAHQLRVLADRVPSPLAYWDCDLRCRFANRAYAECIGSDPERLVGVSASELLGPSLFALSEPCFAGALRGETRSHGGTVRLADGQERDAVTSYHPDIVDGRVIGVSVSITESVDARLLRAEVDSSRLGAIVASSNDAIVGKTLDGRITSWNQAAHGLFGYTAEEAIGQRVQMLIPSDRQDEEMRILASLSRGNRVAPFDTVRRAKDGRHIEVSITISPIRDATGRIVGGSKIVRDITERKAAEQAARRTQQLENENRHIQQANQLKSQFLANMSHELRTPLNAIIGFSDLMLAGKVPPESPKHQAYLGHIATSGRHLLQLINDVLDLAKVESGKLEFSPEPIELRRTVHEVVEILRSACVRKQIKLQVELDARLTGLFLDPVRLKQVLYNYLSNAIKFTADGGQVVVRAVAQPDERFLLEVEDTGVGIAAADLPNLFTEFRQLAVGRAQQYEGTGLGLALTRRLVEAQGGSVGVRSEPGRGSVFHAVLNRVHGTDVARREPGSPSTIRRLLVIEDDPTIQARLLDELVAARFDVTSAGSAAHALRHAIESRFDGVTLDMILPDERGLDLLHRWRRSTPSDETAVVGLTIPTEASGTASFGIADILAKPLRTEELAGVISRLARDDGAPLRVLVIDDDPLALELMRTTLTDMGVAVACVQSARRALEELDDHHPDVIVLDLMMPEVDGFAFLDALHHVPRWQHTPVLIWTSLILTDEEYASLSRSAASVASKGGGALAELIEHLKRWQPHVEE